MINYVATNHPEEPNQSHARQWQPDDRAADEITGHHNGTLCIANGEYGPSHARAGDEIFLNRRDRQVVENRDV
jgi:hypothetical protein